MRGGDSEGVCGEGAGGFVQEEVAWSESEAVRAGSVDDSDGDDAVAARREEVRVGVHNRPRQDGREDLHQRRQRRQRLQRRHRRSIRHDSRRRVLLPGVVGQGPAVELAVDGQRQRVQQDHALRHHVHRQRGAHSGRNIDGRRAHDVCDEVVGAVRHGHGHVDDARNREDRRLDLAELDAETLELHLKVGAAEELQLAVEGAPGEVTRVVHAGAVARERVRDEPRRRQPRPPVVAQGHLRARDVDRADLARRHRPEEVVEQVGPQARDRAADRADVTGTEIAVVQQPVRGVHGGLGDAVHVDQLGPRAVPRDPAAQTSQVERLAGEDHPAQRGQGLVGMQVGVDELVERGRGLAQDRDVAVEHELAEVHGGAGQAVLGHDQPAAVGQRAPQLPHRDVERVGVELGPHVGRPEGHLRRGVDEQRDHVLVRDDDALGTPGRAGRVDQVGRMPPVCRGRDERTGHLLVHAQHASRNVSTREHRREPCPLARFDQSHLGLGVGEHELQAVVRVGQVQRHVRRTGRHDRDQSDDLVQRTWESDGDPCVRADATSLQAAGQPGLGVEELAVGHRLGRAVEAAERHGHRGRVTQGRAVEQLCQRDRHDLGAGTRVRQSGNRNRVPGKQSGQGGDERAHDPRGAFLPHHRRVVDQVEPQRPVEVTLNLQRQRVVRRALVDDVGDLELDSRAQSGLVQRDVEHDQRVERRVPPDPAQRDVLVRQHSGLVPLHRSEQLRSGRRGRPPSAHGNRVDEQADHLVDAGHVRVPPGHRRAEHDVLALQDAAERHAPRAVHGDAQRHPGRT